MFRKIFAVGLCGFILCGCARQRDEYPWKSTYAPAAAAPKAEATKTVAIRPAKYDLLAAGNTLEGYAKIGESRFQGEALEPQETQSNGELAKFARSIGADMVLLGINPAGKQMRTKYVRAAGISQGRNPGNPLSTGGTETDTMAYEYEVDVFDYIAVFLKAKTP